MATFGAVKGKLGTTEYYNAVVTADVLINNVKIASKAFPNWADQTIEERIQREINKKRIIDEMAPYFQKDNDRFFNSIVVDVYEGWDTIEFEPIKAFTHDLKAAYKAHGDGVGFLTLPGGQVLVAIDGQHRLEAIRYAIEGYKDPKTGEYILDPRPDLAKEMLSVLFLKHERKDDVAKVRKLFGKLNRYAKATTTSDNLRMDEVDTFAIISRRLINKGKGGIFEPNGMVDYKRSTLSKNSPEFTTLSSLYEINKLYMRVYKGYDEATISEQERPTDGQIDKYFAEAKEFWDLLLKKIRPISEAFSGNTKDFKEWREGKRSLLFKPAGLVAMATGVILLARHGKVKLEEAVERMNRIDWSADNEAWRHVIIRPDGNIDARAESRRLVANIVAHTLADKRAEKDALALAGSNRQDGLMTYQALKETVARRRGDDQEEGFDINRWELPSPLAISTGAGLHRVA